MQSTRSFVQLIVVIGIASITMSGCMVGPDFHQPAAPKVTHYMESSLPSATAGSKATGKSGIVQHFATNRDISSEWWVLFHSTIINDLIRTGLANSPNLAAAYAALRQAQETLNAQIGNSLFPAVSAQTGVERQLFTGASEGNGLSSDSTIFNIYNANVNVTYTLDVFGGARRQIEALRAQVDFQQFELIAAYLTLTANIVTTSVTVAAFEAQIKASQALLREQEEQLAITRQQFKVGGVSREAILSQETLVEQTRATLPPLEKNLSQSRHALAVLVGDYPNRQFPSINLNTLTLPARLPVSLPSNLVRQRPDVRAAEAQLHAASAQIGVATANLFPQFPLTGSYGWQASAPATLFATTTNFWTIGGQIMQPIFQGGALLAQRRAAIAAYEQSRAQYRQTVLQAFQNVADALRAIETDARTLRAQTAAESAARQNMILTQEQYRVGGVSYLNLLTAEQQYQQTVLARIQAQAARYNDTAALFQALGGGWWHKPWCVKECLQES